MKIEFAVSLWNFTHYTKSPSLERICGQLRDQGLGIELWSSYNQEADLYDQVGRKRLRAALKGMLVSLHSDIFAKNFLDHQKQIDTAAEIGAEVIVIHSDNIYLPDTKEIDVNLANRVVAYGVENGVTIALENGQLPLLKNAIDQIEGLKISLDTGHVYLTEEPMEAFLAALKTSIIHLHIQEVLSSPESSLVGQHGIILDHYTPGTGGIPAEDWKLLFSVLQETDFNGTAVFEIQPRTPLQTAKLGTTFVQKCLAEINSAESE